MNIDEKKLINAISESLRNILFESEKIESLYIIKTYSAYNVDEYQYIKDNKNFIFNFLNEGYLYAGLGNYCGCSSPKSLLKNFNIIKIAYIDNVVIAISVYTGYQDGKKCIGITSTINEKYREYGKSAVIDIVKDDIKLYDNFYWTDCSGALEHYYKKYGGIMIPNDYIELFIGNKFEKKNEDGYHFSVRFKSTDPEDFEDTIINKVIFGFNNKQTYDIVMKKLEDPILRQINYINNSIKETFETLARDTYQAAHDIIYVFYEQRCQGVNEYSQKLLNILSNSAKILEDYIKHNPDDERINKFEIAIWNAHDIIDSSTILNCEQL